MKALTIFSSCAERVVVPLAFLINLFDLLIIPCRLPACWTLIRPLAVTLNLFLALDFVFILGISNSLSRESDMMPGMPLLAGIMRRYSDRGFRTNINNQLNTLPKKIFLRSEFKDNYSQDNLTQIPMVVCFSNSTISV